MQFYIKSKPISVGFSVSDRLNYITYIVGKGIKYPKLKSVRWTFAEFYFNRGLQRRYSGSCTILQKNGFVCLLIVFLKSETHQLNFEGRD